MRWWPPWPTLPDGAAPRRLPRLRAALRAETVLAAGLALLTAALYLAGLFERLELIAIDHRYRAFPAPVRPDILLVLFDSISVKRVGQWPWSRGEHARLVRAVSAAGARAIGYDVEFGKPRDPVEDARLAAAVAEARTVVLPVFRDYKLLPGGGEMYAGTLVMPELRRAGAAAGTITIPEDAGGGIRRAPLAEEVGGDSYWSFSVEVVRRAESLPSDQVRWAGRGRLMLGRRIFRGDRHNMVYIDYAGGRGTFPSVSAVDVLEGRVPPGDVRGKVVLVGATAIELQDLHPSPFPGVMPGVEIQANLVNGFLRGVAARRLPPWITLIGLALLAGAWPPLATRVARGPARITTRALRLAAASGASVAALAAAAAVLFWQWRTFLDVVPLVAAAGGMGAATVVAEAVRTGRRAAISTMALVPARSGAATSPLEQAVDLLFIALRDGMQVQALALDLGRGDRARDVARITRAAGMAPLSQESRACREWAYKTLTSGDGFLVAYLGEAFEAAGPGAPPVPAVGSAFVPLLVGGRAIGVLHAHRTSAPFEPDDLRVIAALAQQLALTVQNLDLMQDLRELHLGTMAALADAVEARDAYTGGHCKRVSDYAVRLARAAGLADADVEEIRFGGLIHDIGKIGISDGILGKVTKLTEEEWRHMQSHTLIGERIVAQLPVSQIVRDIIAYHHERYNGTGYPEGLRGEAIPMPARIVAVADVFEAISSGRVYRAPRSAHEALAELRRAGGGQLDPHLVEIFLGVAENGSVSERPHPRPQADTPAPQPPDHALRDRFPPQPAS
ncbi:MAG TPA: CHASE2 domain-containing protein [Candidatus Methylomirabilis sp.]